MMIAEGTLSNLGVYFGNHSLKHRGIALIYAHFDYFNISTVLFICGRTCIKKQKKFEVIKERTTKGDEFASGFFFELFLSSYLTRMSQLL